MDSDGIVRRNLQALIDAAKDHPEKGQPATVLDLEAETGIGKSTLYRMLRVDPPEDERPNTTLAVLTAIATVYGIPVWYLLFPHYSPAAPPHVLSVEERALIARRERLYRLVQRIADDEDESQQGSGENAPDHRQGASGQSVQPAVPLPALPAPRRRKKRHTRPAH